MTLCQELGGFLICLPRLPYMHVPGDASNENELPGVPLPQVLDTPGKVNYKIGGLSMPA